MENIMVKIRANSSKKVIKNSSEKLHTRVAFIKSIIFKKILEKLERRKKCQAKFSNVSNGLNF